MIKITINLLKLPVLVQSRNYWSATEYAPNPVSAWVFNMKFGSQTISSKTTFSQSAWAVQSGDIVPIPATVWLFGSGLIGLIGLARRKTHI